MHILLTGNTPFVLVNFRAGPMRALIENGHVLSALVPDGSRMQELRTIPCSIIPLRMNSQGTDPLRESGVFLSFLRAISRAEPDVILSFTVKNNLYGGIVARLLGIAFLPNVTGLGTSFSSAGLLNRVVVGLYRRGLRKAPIVFFQNREDGAELERLGIVTRNQIRVLPGSGVDLDAFRPMDLPGGVANPTFLLIGRMLWDKGLREFVEAARLVRHRFPGARFQLLGSLDLGGRSAVPASILAEWTEEGAVTYLGSVTDVRPLMAAADCIVLPSYYREGVPRTLLEAAAMARPIITTDMPGCRDAVEDDVTGLLCRPRSSADLAAKLCGFLSMSVAARVAMGRAGRLRAETVFDERLVVEAYRQAIDLVAASSRRC